MKNEIVVVGGGASGLMCAIELAKNNFDVLVLERKDRILKKILVTGNGRCNITNDNISIKNYFSLESDVQKIENILNKFTKDDTIKFFNDIGIISTVKSRGKIYPLSEQASSVVDALRFEAEKLGVKIITDFYVTKIEKDSFNFKLYSEDKKIVTCKKVILSCGGQSYPELGSNGSGYELAKKLGHKITKLVPTIVQLKTDEYDVKGLKGIKLDVNLTAISDGEKICTYDGELLFTETGVSGNVIFNISFVYPIYKNLIFEIDFLPSYNYIDLYNILIDRREKLSYLTMENFFNGMINKKLGQFLTKKSGIEKLSKEVHLLTDNEIKKICEILKKYKIKIIDTTGFKNAQVTAGGVSLEDVNCETLESKKVKGLYFTGEILDVYGECGGYNLQWAWASGYVVAKSICNI